jgi:hypothetical protein
MGTEGGDRRRWEQKEFENSFFVSQAQVLGPTEVTDPQCI